MKKTLALVFLSLLSLSPLVDTQSAPSRVSVVPGPGHTDDLDLGQVVIDFDDARGQPTPHAAGSPVGLDRLIDIEYHFLGVIFDSAGGGVGRSAPSNPVSPPNVVSATAYGPVWSYTDPVTATFWKGDRPGVVDYVQTTLTSSSSTSTLLAFDENGMLVARDTGGARATLRVAAAGQIRSVRIEQGPMAFDNFTFETPSAVAGLALSPLWPGQAGRWNRIRVTGGASGGLVLVTAEFGPAAKGRLRRPWERAQQIVVLDALGEGEVSFPLPAGLAGLAFTARAYSSTGESARTLADILAPPADSRASLPTPGTQALVPMPPNGL